MMKGLKMFAAVFSCTMLAGIAYLGTVAPGNGLEVGEASACTGPSCKKGPGKPTAVYNGHYGIAGDTSSQCIGCTANCNCNLPISGG